MKVMNMLQRSWLHRNVHGTGRYVMLITLLLLIGKVIWECCTGRALFVSSDDHLVLLPLAHATGLVSAFVCWLVTMEQSSRGIA